MQPTGIGSDHREQGTMAGTTGREKLKVFRNACSLMEHENCFR